MGYLRGIPARLEEAAIIDGATRLGMAGPVSAAVPVMALYDLIQRFVVQGLAAGAVKG